MTALYYDSRDRIALADDPFFPDEEGAIETAFAAGEAVSVEEWKTYYVRAYGEKDLTFLRSAPFYGTPFHGRVFEINFRNYVGLSRIGNINLRVRNRKIGEALFDSMLGYVSDKYADLIFSFNTSVGLEYEKGKAGQDILYLQYLFLKKYLFDSRPNIDEIAGLILSRPHRRVETETHKCFIDECDHFDVGLSLGLFSDSGNLVLLDSEHPLLSSRLARIIHDRTGKGYYPSKAVNIKKYHTFDTNENRFVKYFVQEIAKKLDSIENLLGARAGSFLNPDILNNTRLLNHKVRYLLSDPIWTDVGRMNFIPVQSTVLQRREGYRHLFRLYSLLQLVTRYQILIRDFRSLIEIKSVPTLFEYWCFFLVKEILDLKFKRRGISIILSHSETEQVVREGVAIEYENDLRLIYNADFQGSTGVEPMSTDISRYQTGESYSHQLRPDIVIVKKGREKLVLDAKYKGKDMGGMMYGQEVEGGTISRYKEEDLDKMHTYREAIEGVYGAFALYPGEESVIYPSHRAERHFQGIGALPLKPVPGGKPRAEDIARVTQTIDEFIGV